MAQMKNRRWMVVALALLSPMALMADEIEVQNEWSIVAASKQINELGIEHFVGDKETWELLWSQLAPDEECAQVDFAQSLVLLHVRDKNDPNKFRFRVRLVPAESTDNASDSQGQAKPAEGIVELVGMSTRMGFEKSETSQMTLMEIPRKEVTALKIYDPAKKTQRHIPIDSARVIVRVAIPKTIATFDGETMIIRLFEYDPYLADVSATLVERADKPELSHQSGTADQMTVVVGSDHRLNPKRSYYVTCFIENQDKRTHMGEEKPRGEPAKVLTDEEKQRVVSLVVRALK